MLTRVLSSLNATFLLHKRSIFSLSFVFLNIVVTDCKLSATRCNCWCPFPKWVCICISIYESFSKNGLSRKNWSVLSVAVLPWGSLGLGSLENTCFVLGCYFSGTGCSCSGQEFLQEFHAGHGKILCGMRLFGTRFFTAAYACMVQVHLVQVLVRPNSFIFLSFHNTSLISLRPIFFNVSQTYFVYSHW